ncbi:MAG: VOC family protein [Yersinia sp. (in: enterobacteria)]
MIKFNGLGHINIVVNDLTSASSYYQSLFGAIPQQEFPHFKNTGFAKSAGFMLDPDNVDVSIQFMEIPRTGIFIELMEYHKPIGLHSKEIDKKANTINGIGHICLRVNSIDSAFNYIKNHPEIKLITSHPEYKPFKINSIKEEEFFFFDKKTEDNKEEKEKVCKIVGQIKYFYFIDKHGIQWELEEGHSDIGS